MRPELSHTPSHPSRRAPHRRRMQARALRWALGLAGLPLVVGTAMAPTEARADAKSATCRVNAVLARKVQDGPRIPKNLAFMAKELESDEFAAYKSFKLLDAENYQLEAGKKLERGLKSGHRVGLELLGGDAKKSKFNVTITKPGASKALLSTIYGIKNNGILIVGGLKHEDGRLLFAIQCTSK